MIDSTSLVRSESDLRREIVRRIVGVTDPDKVIVFGSRARGDQRPDSDVDVLAALRGRAGRAKAPPLPVNPQNRR